ESAVCAEQGLGLDLVRVADDHCLAAAEVESGERVLIRHRLRKVQDISECGSFILIGIKPGTAERWPKRSREDSDDGAHPGLLGLAEDNFLKAGLAVSVGCPKDSGHFRAPAIGPRPR